MLSHMLPACGLGGKTLLAAGVASLMLYLAGHHLPHKGNTWELLVLVFVLYPLLKVSGVLVRLQTRLHSTSLSFSYRAFSPYLLLSILWQIQNCRQNVKKNHHELMSKTSILLKQYQLKQCVCVIPKFTTRWCRFWTNKREVQSCNYTGIELMRRWES